MVLDPESQARELFKNAAEVVSRYAEVDLAISSCGYWIIRKPPAKG